MVEVSLFSVESMNLYGQIPIIRIINSIEIVVDHLQAFCHIPPPPKNKDPLSATHPVKFQMLLMDSNNLGPQRHGLGFANIADVP